jgi:spore coat protein A
MKSSIRIRRVSTLGAAIVLTARLASAHAPLDASTLTKYLDPLPNPLVNVIAPSGMLDGVPLYDVSISQFQQQLHSQLPPTTLWGYNGTYPGPTFDVNRGQPIKVSWTNNLVDDMGQPLKHLLPYDPTLHGADYPGAHMGHDGGEHGEFSDYPQARTVTHLHGGVVDQMSDGYPEHWFSPNPNAAPNGLGGPAGNSHITDYPNDQRAATMWYHDHAMAITRLNVYAGMAGFYLLRDADEAALDLPSGQYEVPLVIQDKSFFDNGALYYPGGDEHDPSAPGTHVASFFGDANIVNGKVWPYLEVEPRRYRFRLLNGANSRSYNL